MNDWLIETSSFQNKMESWFLRRQTFSLKPKTETILLIKIFIKKNSTYAMKYIDEF